MFILRIVLAAQLLLASWVASAADVVGTVTILEGDALVYRGASRVLAAEGVRLEATDIVDTGAKTFMQIELPDASILQLGPRTRLMLNLAARGQKPERSVYVMDGWLKLVANKRDPRGGPGLDVRSSLLEVVAQPSTLVMKFTAAEVLAFAEAGEVKLLERQATGPAVAVSLKSGDFYQRKAGAKGVVSATLKGALISEMPRAFRDTLPPRIERFKDKPPTPKAAPDFAYADVEPWLKSEAALRRQFVQRWREKAKEPAFRSALAANLNAHPEWDPILYPEKYVPKPRPPREVATPTLPAPTPAPAPQEPPQAQPASPSLPPPVQALPPPTQ